MELYNSIQKLIEVTSFSPDMILLIVGFVVAGFFFIYTFFLCLFIELCAKSVDRLFSWLSRLWKKNKPH